MTRESNTDIVSRLLENDGWTRLGGQLFARPEYTPFTPVGEKPTVRTLQLKSDSPTNAPDQIISVSIDDLPHLARLAAAIENSRQNQRPKQQALPDTDKRRTPQENAQARHKK